MPHRFSPTYQELEEFVSADRLAKYLQLAKNDRARAAALYLEKLNACRRFYGLVHWLEIGLRNAMNCELIKAYSKQWYENRSLRFQNIEYAQIQTAITRLREQRKPVDNPDMVAAISFGFWVNLFNSPYEQLWRYNLRKAFRGRTDRMTRHEITGRLRPLLNLRNRVAHYEPILHLPLDRLENSVWDIIGWIEPEMAKGR